MSRRKSIDKFMKAFEIMKPYETDRFGTHCEHDSFYVFGVDIDSMSDYEIEKLDELGFIKSEEVGEQCFLSFRYGSC